MNKPAAVLFQHDLNPTQREELLGAARTTILAFPGITHNGTIILDANAERSSICIRFMSHYPQIDARNADILSSMLQEMDIKSSEPSNGMLHMDLGDFLVYLAGLVVEQIGVRCADTGKCHHGCTTECFRKTCCEPLSVSGLGPNWKPLEPKRTADVLLQDDRVATYVDNDDVILNNGIYNVKNRVVMYRGFKIKPKLDFGNSPYRSHGNVISTGWVVIDQNGCLALPGAAWDSSILEARASIDLWIESGFDAKKFWELMEPYRY